MMNPDGYFSFEIFAKLFATELRQELVTTPVDLSRFALLAEPMYTSAEASEVRVQLRRRTGPTHAPFTL